MNKIAVSTHLIYRSFLFNIFGKMRITSLKAIKYSVWMCVDYTFITILLLYLWDQRKNRVLLILSLIPTPKWPGFFWAPPPFLVICCIFHIFTWICKEIIDLRWSFVHPLLPFNMPLFTQSWFVFKNYFQLKFSPPHSYLNPFLLFQTFASIASLCASKLT